MNTDQIANLAFKLVGIVAIIQAVRLLPELLELAAWDVTDQSVNVALLVLARTIPFTLLFCGGCLLIAKSAAFTRLTTRKSAIANSAATAADIHSILLSSVGFLLVGISINAVPSIVHNFALFYSALGQQLPPERSSIVTGTWIRLGGVILQMGFGLCLVFGGSTIVSLLRRRFDRSKVIAADGHCPHCGFWFESGDYRSGAVAYLCSNCKQEIPRDLIAPASDRISPPLRQGE